MKKWLFCSMLMSSLCLGGVSLVPDGSTDLTIGDQLVIKFSIIDPLPVVSFFGAVEWVGVGYLTPPIIYDDLVGILPILPEGDYWPIAFDPGPAVWQGTFFGETTYITDVSGPATINLYQFNGMEGTFDLIDSLYISVLPEPAGFLLLTAGAVIIRGRRKTS